MCPIENLSNIVRLPRLGKIHLGIKVETPGKHPYPKATDYFVVPREIQEVFGEQPKEIEIMFPSENPEQFAQQWYRRYSMTQGLTCIGDGVTARGKIDVASGALAGRDTKGWEWKEGLRCDPQECPEYPTKRCRRVMNLQILIPKVVGLGVWQIDTSSFYSIVNCNSMIQLLKSLAGRCSFIPLKLCLGPIEVTPPGQKKKTVYIMHIRQDMKLADIARLGQIPAPLALLPEPEAAEPPEDLFPEEIIEGEVVEDEENREAPEVEEPQEPFFPDEAPKAVSPPPQLFENWGQLAEAALKLGISPSQVMARAKKKRWTDFASYADAWKVVEELVNEKDKSPKML
jgi:hypothetical protein